MSLTKHNAKLRQLKPYAEYMITGEDWIRRIPSHWSYEKLKHIASIQTSNVDKKSEEGETPVSLCNYVDVYYNDAIDTEIDFMHASATTAEIAKFSLRADDVLITKDSESWNDIAVPAHVQAADPGVLCGYHLAQIRPIKRRLSGAFLARAFAAIGIRDQFCIAATGVTRYGLSRRWINDARFPLPPIDEQRTIARFLDRETGKIDALVAKKEELIKLLEEQRTALITHAVTKGLDPTVPMKDSGVEWLGKIPSHWSATQLRRLARENTSITYGIVQAGPNIPGGVPYIKTSDMAGNELPEEGYQRTTQEIDSSYKRSKLEPGDVVVAIRATVGKALRVPKSLAGANLTQGTAKVSPGPDITSEFLLMALQSRRIQARFAALAKGATFKEITLDMLRRLTIAVPPVSEQHKIVRQVLSIQNPLDAAVTMCRDVKSNIKELRTALISGAVTGKIDVREEA